MRIGPCAQGEEDRNVCALVDCKQRKLLELHVTLVHLGEAMNYQDLGKELVQASEEGDFSAQRGLMDELFPYVFDASRRMSARAISRWLEQQGTKLSAATVAKALRNPDRYWAVLWDEIEPVARRFSEAQDTSMMSFLLEDEFFNHLCEQPPRLAGSTGETVWESFDDFKDCVAFLSERWFGLSRFVREACLESVKLEEQERGEDPSEKSNEA